MGGSRFLALGGVFGRVKVQMEPARRGFRGQLILLEYGVKSGVDDWGPSV